MGFFFSTWGDLTSWHKMDLATERRVDFGAGRNGKECKICGQREKLLQSAKGTCDWGNDIMEAPHPQCDLLGGGTCTIKHFLQRELQGDPTKGAFRKPLPALFLALSSLGTGLAPSAHSPPRPGVELAIP